MQAGTPTPRTPVVVARCALHPVPRTLLLPLAARAYGGERFPWLACEDHEARRLLSCVQPEPRQVLEDTVLVLNVLWRTRVLKQTARAFFDAHPRAAGVNLGCGLSHPYQWLDNGRNTWLDADLPEVMALRRQLLPARPPRWRDAELDLRHPGWWQALGLPARKPGGAAPVFALCEGVSMYLRPREVSGVLREFAAEAPSGSQLLADFISYLGVGRARALPSLAHSQAQFRWGAHTWSDFTDAHPRLRLLARRSVAECGGWAAEFAEAVTQPLLGPALYGMVLLGV